MTICDWVIVFCGVFCSVCSLVVVVRVFWSFIQYVQDAVLSKGESKADYDDIWGG